MDAFLSKLTQHAMNYAIRSGITITASYAIRQSSRLLKNVHGEAKMELMRLQDRLQNKIRIISPAIDMIELIAARGNTSLESSIALTKSLRLDIQALGQRLERTAAVEELARKGAASSRDKSNLDHDIKAIIFEIKALLDRIEDAVPLINLAITTSGVSLSTNLPSTVSPSRLLQASTFLTAGDTQYFMSPSQGVQIGPTFTLSIYMLFAGHIRPQTEEHMRNTTWKEVIHKARVKLRRVPMDLLNSVAGEPSPVPGMAHNHLKGEVRTDEFAYQILIIEDLDDERGHSYDTPEEAPDKFDDVQQAGIREVIPIHQISKIFYADTGKILNIGSEGGPNSPILLLKRDVNAIPPRRMIDQYEAVYQDWDEDDDAEQSVEDDVQSQLDSQILGDITESSIPGPIPKHRRFPPDLDLEWIAFEVYEESVQSDAETETETEPETSTSSPPNITDTLENTHLDSSPSRSRNEMAIPEEPTQKQQLQTISNPLFNSIKTSLSLLEMLLRLTSLQQFQQQSHLSITDELLNFFLEESSATGAGGDEQHRQRLRAEARDKVGWDPYDESPIKLRGEDYQYGNFEEQQWERARPYPLDPDRAYSSPMATPDPRNSGQRRRFASDSPLPGTPASPSPASSSVRVTRGEPAMIKGHRYPPRAKDIQVHSGDTDEGIGRSPESGSNSEYRRSHRLRRRS